MQFRYLRGMQRRRAGYSSCGLGVPATCGLRHPAHGRGHKALGWRRHRGRCAHHRQRCAHAAAPDLELPLQDAPTPPPLVLDKFHAGVERETEAGALLLPPVPCASAPPQSPVADALRPAPISGHRRPPPRRIMPRRVFSQTLSPVTGALRPTPISVRLGTGSIHGRELTRPGHGHSTSVAADARSPAVATCNVTRSTFGSAGAAAGADGRWWALDGRRGLVKTEQVF
jgi:hypothetical protein